MVNWVEVAYTFWLIGGKNPAVYIVWRLYVAIRQLHERDFQAEFQFRLI